MANIGRVPAMVQSVFAMLDQDANNVIDEEVFKHLIQSLLAEANIANNDEASRVQLHALFSNFIPSLPNPHTPGELNLQQFWRVLQSWTRTIEWENREYLLIGGGVLTSNQFRKILHRTFQRLAQGDLFMPQLPAPVLYDDDGNVIMDANNDPVNLDLDVQNIITDAIGGVPPEIAASAKAKAMQAQAAPLRRRRRRRRQRLLASQLLRRAPEPEPEPAPVILPTSIDLNANGHDIMFADEDKNIATFIQESHDDGERPIVMKVLDVNLNEANARYYLYTLSNFQHYAGGAGLDNITVYPCFEANGLSRTEAHQDNIDRGRPLLSMNKLIARRFNVEKNQFNAVVNMFAEDAIYLVFVNQNGETVPSIASLPFHVGMGVDHCGGGAEPEQIWSVIQGVPVAGAVAPGAGEVKVGGKRKKRKIRRRRTNKKKSKSKAKKRSRRIYHRRKKKTIKKNKSKSRKRKRTRNINSFD